MIFNLVSGGGKPKITYTGTYTTEDYTADGKTYTLYKLTGSGTLSVKGRAKGVGVWLCGGGANGVSGANWDTVNPGPYASASALAPHSYGGAGAYCAQLDNASLKGDYVVTVGAAQGASSFGSLLSVTAVSGSSGGTGGGKCTGYGSYGTGDGLAKYPFGDTSLECHCAGGGAGGAYFRGEGNTFGSTFKGGTGGTNGGGGGSSTEGGGNGGTNGPMTGGSGGVKGGGTGGGSTDNLYQGSVTSGTSATFYGSGGGGGGSMLSFYNSDASSGSGGAGYQGIVYLRVPV